MAYRASYAPVATSRRRSCILPSVFLPYFARISPLFHPFTPSCLQVALPVTFRPRRSRHNPAAPLDLRRNAIAYHMQASPITTPPPRGGSDIPTHSIPPFRFSIPKTGKRVQHGVITVFHRMIALSCLLTHFRRYSTTTSSPPYSPPPSPR